VVSTTLGAEGIGAQDGVHLLIADTVPALAEATSRLVHDGPLREALTSEAHRLFSERFRSDTVEADIERLAREVADRKVS